MTVTTGPVTPMEFLFALRGITPANITMLRTPGHGIRDAGNVYLGEKLEPAAYTMFAAVREGRLAQFVAAHPDLVSHGADLG
jgi:hypothetical protein